jgi:hypothetical protein
MLSQQSVIDSIDEVDQLVNDRYQTVIKPLSNRYQTAINRYRYITVAMPLQCHFESASMDRYCCGHSLRSVVRARFFMYATCIDS